MSLATWLLADGRPVIEIELAEKQSDLTFTRTLLADTGGGSSSVPVHMVLSVEDIERCGGIFRGYVGAGGAIAGNFKVCALNITISALNLVRLVNVMAVPAETLPDGLGGIACFRFLNSFTYGNFGDPAAFGLETP